MKRLGCYRILAVAAAACLACFPAHADPITITAALSVYIGGTAAAAVASALVFAAAYGGYIIAAYSVYGGIRSRRNAKKAASAARAAYNNSLTDRVATVLRAEPPFRVVYGRCITGGDIVAIFTTDKQGRRDNGSSYTKPDGIKHLVVAVAAHEVEAIHDVLIDGVPVGPLNASGWAIGGEFQATSQASQYQEVQVLAGEDYTFPGPVTVISMLALDESDGQFSFTALPFVINGNTVTNTDPQGRTGRLSVTLASSTSGVVRVEKHLGTASQQASAYLRSVAPAEWLPADRLAGIAYVIVSLDLEEQRFQGGPPALSFDVSGAKVLDPRTGQRAWSENTALIVRDWLTAEYGFAVPPADIVDASVIAAANACDVSIPLQVGATTTMGATYTCNGTVTTEASPEAVLDELCQSMAGFATHTGGNWVVNAGAYTMPVMHLSEDIQAGSIEVAQVGVGFDELINGVRGRMIEAGRTAEAEIDPYSNAAYVAADGQELWEDMLFPWTDNRARARNLARIFVESNRESLVVRYPAQLHAWPLQIGDRVTVSSAEYGWDAKSFRVTDWSFGLDSPVLLTLQEDSPEIYDLADAATVDQAPNTGLQSPWLVPAMSGVVAASGNALALVLADGTRVPRVRVSWAAVANGYVQQGGNVVVRWRRVGIDEVGSWRTVLAPGDATADYLLGAAEGDVLSIGVKARNSLGSAGAETIIQHQLQGLGGTVASVQGLAGAAEGGILTWSWQASTSIDYAATALRAGGASWEDAAPLWTGAANSLALSVTQPGDYTVWAKHYTRNGAESGIAATATVTVTAAQIGGVGPSGQPGTSQALAELYQWASSAPPANPTGESTWTWATAAHTAYTGGGWRVTVPANPGTPGARLWVAAKSVVAPAGTATSVVSWLSGFGVYAATVNGAQGPGGTGSPGASGIQAATPTVYRWAASIPAIAGSSTYTWATASISPVPNNWTAQPGTGSPGQTLWGASVQLVEAATVTASNVNWSSASITPRGYAGLDGAAGQSGGAGAPGQPGISARRAYTLTTASSLGSGTVTTTGAAARPPANSVFGNGLTWAAQPATPAVGQVLYQSDGLYNPSTTQTNWETPYISALKVGNLAALAVNTGSLTVSDSISVSAAGQITGGAITSFAWPGNGSAGGFYLGPSGFLVGNRNTPGRGYFAIDTNGIWEMNGVSYNAGTNTTTFTGRISGGAIFGGGSNATYAWSPTGTGYHLSQSGLAIGNANLSGGVELRGDGGYAFIGRVGGPRMEWAGGALSINGGTILTGTAVRSGATMTGTGATFGANGTGSWGTSAINITHDGSQIRINGPLVTDANLALSALSVTATPTSIFGLNNTPTNSGAVYALGASSLVPANGTPPYRYAWAAGAQFAEPSNAPGEIYIQSISGALGWQANFAVRGQKTTQLDGGAPNLPNGFSLLTANFVGTVTDANGRSASVVLSVSSQKGSPP